MKKWVIWIIISKFSLLHSANLPSNLFKDVKMKIGTLLYRKSVGITIYILLTYEHIRDIKM